MPYIRKVRSGRSIHLAVSSCTTTRFVVGWEACRRLETILEALRGGYMHDYPYDLRRIHLPRTPVNRLIHTSKYPFATASSD